MDKIKVAKQLVKLAKSLVANDEGLMQYFDIVKREYQSYKINFKYYANSLAEAMEEWGWWLDYNQWSTLGELKFKIQNDSEIVIFNGNEPNSNMPGNFILTVDIDKKSYNFEMPQVCQSFRVPDDEDIIAVIKGTDKYKQLIKGTNKYKQLIKRINEFQQEYNELRNVFHQNKMQTFIDEESFKNSINKLFIDVNETLKKIRKINDSCYEFFEEISNLHVYDFFKQEFDQMDQIEETQDEAIQEELGKFKGIKEVNKRNITWDSSHGKSKSYWRSKKHDENKKQREVKRKEQSQYKNKLQENDFDN